MLLLCCREPFPLMATSPRDDSTSPLSPGSCSRRSAAASLDTVILDAWGREMFDVSTNTCTKKTSWDETARSARLAV